MASSTRCLRAFPMHLTRPFAPHRSLRPCPQPLKQLRRASNRPSSVRRLTPAESQKKAATTVKLPQKEQPSGVLYPKTRIAIGTVLISMLIYSMATQPLQPTSGPEKAEAPSIADLDARRKRESGVTSTSPMRLRMEAFIKEQQDEIVRALGQLEGSGSKFRRDSWQRPAGGEGVSCVLQDGNVFEKAGVNTSIVYGTLPRPAIQKMRVNHKALDDPDIESLEFFAAGLSLVLHPVNPMAPTVHFNYRYFETMDKDGKGKAWWFGGGTDLTPSYLFDEDAVHFHRTIKETCDRHGKEYYPRFKAWCDKYFFIPHRGEARGVGGIFFDDLDEDTSDQESLFSFVQESCKAFLPSYLPILQRRVNMPHTEQEKAWQQLRRGRYVEFNLVHDRGTSFGLNTPGARVESILMSLPLTARWQYMHEPDVTSREERLLSVLRQPREWV